MSVVIPLFDKAAFVERCLASIHDQTFTDFEIIVVDDGSRDDGPARVQARLRDRDRLLRQVNAGVSAARNQGIAAARGRLVAFLDADDEWEPGFLQAIADAHAAHPDVEFFATGYRQRFAGGEDIEIVADVPQGQVALLRDYFTRIQAGPFVWTGAVALRTAALRELGGFQVGVTHGEDLDLWARMALRSPVAYDPRVLATYKRDVPGAATAAGHRDPCDLVLQRVRVALAAGDGWGDVLELRSYHDFLVRQQFEAHVHRGSWNEAAALGSAVELDALCRWAARAARHSVTRPLAGLLVRARVVPTSRLWLRLRGGGRCAGGIRMRRRRR